MALRGAKHQGTERLLVDAPNIFHERQEGLEAALEALMVEGGDRQRPFHEFMFPNAVGIPDVLHICYDALEDSLKALPSWKLIEQDLRDVTSFLSWRQLRQKFMACCLSSGKDRRMFVHFTSRLIDFKFEFLSGVLDEVLPVLDKLLSLGHVALPCGVAGQSAQEHRSPCAAPERGVGFVGGPTGHQ